MQIRDFFRENPRCAVAFSGGVDSAWLLHEAAAYGEKTAAYFVKTQFQPAFELEDAQDAAQRLDVPLTVLGLDVLALPEVASNPPDRCYHCKRAIFTSLLEAAEADGFPQVVDGSNASDDAGGRPGMRALRELGVRSPLRECGVTKAEVRRLAREAGLPVWDKPSYACLATRVPTGTAITAADLGRVERGERLLMEMGFSGLRLRLRGEDGLLQVCGGQWEAARRRLDEIQGLLAADFREVRLDGTPRLERET